MSSTPAPAHAIHLRYDCGDSTQPPFADVALQPIVDAIDRSTHLLDFPDDWDDDGSPAYTWATWARATAFLWRSALRLWEASHRTLEAPRILPGPAGSIDLHWKTAHRELLITIPATLGDPAHFYGDHAASRDHPPPQLVKGLLDLSKDHHWLLLWLVQ